MSDELQPETTAEAVALAKWDVVALLAKIRSRGVTADEREALVREAYARVFAGDLGRLVLLHHLQACGVGAPVGIRAADAMFYGAGMHDAAVMLANEAGYDDAARAVVILSQDLPEEPSDARSDPGPFTVPEPDADF